MNQIGDWFERLIPDALAVFKRFPFATLMITGLTLIWILANNTGIERDILNRLAGGTVLATYLSVILTLVSEGRGTPVVANLIKALTCVASIAVCYFSQELAFQPLLAIGAAILFLGSAPFWRDKRDDAAVWDFTHKIWTAALFAGAGVFIYVMGLLAINTALETLFGLGNDEFVFDWLLPIGVAFLAPVSWLSMVPGHDEKDSGDSLRNPGFISRAVGFLGTWILAPLTLVYTLILVAYGLKIIITGTLPKGEIALFVTPFLIIGTLTWLILNPPFIQQQRLARWFTRLWFPFLIPTALLLAVATFVRIGEYGWTIERYLLALVVIWALGLGVWFTFRGEPKRDIRLIPGFAALLLACASIGPWGADGFSSINQGGRLVKALNANNMLDSDGRMKPVADLEITDEEARAQAGSALDYLVLRRKERRIRKLLPMGEDLKIGDEQPDLRGAMESSIFKQWGGNSTVKKRFGVENSTVKVQHLTTHFENSEALIDVRGYEYVSLIDGGSIHFTRKEPNVRREIAVGAPGTLSMSSESAFLILNDENEELAKLDMLDWLGSQETDVGKIKLEPRLVLYKNGDKAAAIYITKVIVRPDNPDIRGSIDFILMTRGFNTDDK